MTAVAAGDVIITATASPSLSGTAHVTVLPGVVAHLPLTSRAFGSAVSSRGVGWAGQTDATVAQRLDIPFGGMVASINTATLAIVDSVRLTGDGYGVTATPAGDTVFVGITDGPIYKIDLAGRTILNTLTGLPTAARSSWRVRGA